RREPGKTKTPSASSISFTKRSFWLPSRRQAPFPASQKLCPKAVRCRALPENSGRHHSAVCHRRIEDNHFPSRTADIFRSAPRRASADKRRTSVSKLWRGCVQYL